LLNRKSQAETALALADFLDSGNDASTGEYFKVTVGGRLSGAPTTRIASLDWLGVADPQLAHQYSRGVLRNTNSSEEAAVALRNIGRGLTPGVSESFSRAAREFVRKGQWRTDPTRGYFEGFDALVYSGSYEDMLAARDVALTNPRLRGFVVSIIDAVVSKDPEVRLRDILNNIDDWQKFTEFFPLWFSRAYPSGPETEELLASFLAKDNIERKHKLQLIRIYPQFAKMTAPRLLTNDRIVSVNEAENILVSASRLIDKLSREPRFHELRPALRDRSDRILLEVRP